MYAHDFIRKNMHISVSSGWKSLVKFVRHVLQLRRVQEQVCQHPFCLLRRVGYRPRPSDIHEALYWNTNYESRVSVVAAPGSHPSEDEVAG